MKACLSRMSNYYVYIMGNHRPTLYIGVTNNLIKRVYEHKNGAIAGFTQKYGLHKLLYFEIADNPQIAIEREKQLKHWNREWKLQFIQKANPEFSDLYSDIVGLIPACAGMTEVGL